MPNNPSRKIYIPKLQSLILLRVHKAECGNITSNLPVKGLVVILLGLSIFIVVAKYTREGCDYITPKQQYILCC